MRLLDAKNLLDELKIHYENSKLWCINDWNADIPQRNLERLGMLADFAKSHNPSSAGKIKGHMDRINELTYETRRAAQDMDEIEKTRRAAEDTDEIDVEAFVEHNKRWFEAAREWETHQEQLRLYILEFLDLLSSVISETRCPKCGKQNPSQAEFCGFCGAKLRE